ncbi:MAG: MFS transporter, partial [Candidatus Heimdallarchaeota archaeon]|nr:MFS transporter [Candidatus Heimdallarchaeota archaeon]
NKNVKNIFYFQFLQSFGRGIWGSTILSAYIYLLANNSNKILGYTSAATGIAMTLVVFPSGYLSDKYRRDYLLKIASICGTIALFFTGIANNIEFILIGLIFWGLTQGISRPSIESLLADSIPSGNRSDVYSKLHLVRNVGMSVGPFFNVLIFLLIGDEWDLQKLRQVMLIGLLISFLSLLFLLFISDDNSLGNQSEALDINEETKISLSEQFTLSKKSIPYILVTSNLLIGVGAGMTIKFFPIFFLDIYNLKPISVNLIMGVTTIFTGITAIIAQKKSVSKGRAKMIFIVQSFATVSLFIIAFYPVIYILIPLFILRGALMNASQPLSRSILMDFIPKKNRGKWNSMEAFAWGFFWNFSAALGGILIENYDYRVNFIITGLIYTVGTLLILILIPLVQSENYSN